MRLKVGERPHLWMFSFGSARNCRSKSFPTSPKGRRGPGPCAGTHTVRPPSVRMRPDAARCGHRALRGACFSLSLCRGGACPRPPVPGLRCAAGVIPRPARAIESLWRKNAPSSVTASPCHLPPRGGEVARHMPRHLSSKGRCVGASMGPLKGFQQAEAVPPAGRRTRCGAYPSHSSAL